MNPEVFGASDGNDHGIHLELCLKSERVCPGCSDRLPRVCLGWSSDLNLLIRPSAAVSGITVKQKLWRLSKHFQRSQSDPFFGVVWGVFSAATVPSLPVTVSQTPPLPAAKGLIDILSQRHDSDAISGNELAEH